METVKVCWTEIKHEIKEANPEFYSLINKINPPDTYSLYVVTFPYGVLIGDDRSQFLPINNQLVRINESTLPEEIERDLGYGKMGSPMGMVLRKNFEWYVDLPGKKNSLPIMVQKPGDFFSYSRLIGIKNKFNYSPMGVLLAMSGARSAFLLPSIGCKNKFSRMCRQLKIKTKAPDSLYEHFGLFKNLIDNWELTQNNIWRSAIVYFSESWVDSIKNDPEWADVKNYFYNSFFKKAIYLKNLPYYQMGYSIILEEYNLKPNPYLLDTFKHLIDIACGESPGFSPQVCDNFVPLSVLHEIFISQYGLKDTAPAVMAPDYLVSHQQPSFSPVYYSLQIPTTMSFSPKSKQASTMVSLREIKDLTFEVIMAIKEKSYLFSDTIVQHVANSIDFSFFHNSIDIDGLISDTKEIVLYDNRFLASSVNSYANSHFADDSKFFRGCIRVSHKLEKT